MNATFPAEEAVQGLRVRQQAMPACGCRVMARNDNAPEISFEISGASLMRVVSV
jgi:hypothetical protein